MLFQLAFQKLWSGLTNLFTDILQRKHDQPHRVKADDQKRGYLGASTTYNNHCKYKSKKPHYIDIITIVL